MPQTQQVGLARDLVTYCAISWTFSNSLDLPFAIGARDGGFRSHGSNYDFALYSTNGADSWIYWLCGTPIWCRTVDAIGSERWDRTTPCNADTHVDRTWAPAIVNFHKPGKQIHNAPPADHRKKTDSEQENKTLQRTLLNKTEREEEPGIIKRKIQIKCSP